jgi:undecaprenyl-diphosphatase
MMRAVELRSKLRSSLSIHTALALGAGVVAAIAFLEVAGEVLEGEAMAFDRPVSLWLHRFDSRTLDQVMRALTFLGSVPAIIAVVALVAAWAMLRGARSLAGVLVAVASVAEGLNVLLKLLFQRPRPDIVSKILVPDSYSFPSGHAMVSTAVYGMVAVTIARLAPRLRRPLYTITPVVVLLIGVSRVFLGVHWPTDVLAGFAAGGLVLAAVDLALWRARRSSSGRVGAHS